MNETTTTNGNYAAPHRTFIESINVCFAKYATFKGRASRSEFWWFFLLVCLVSFVVVVTGYLLDNDLSDSIFARLWSLSVRLPLYAVGARRLHDTGRNGWWMLLAVPADLIPESNELYDLVFLIIWFPLIVMLCFRSKTDPAT